MSQKYKILLQKTKKTLVKMGGLVFAFAIIFIGFDFLAGEQEKIKLDAESRFIAASGTLANLTSQLDKSSESGNNYLALLEEHPNTNFGIDEDTLVTWLRNARLQYHFGQPRLTRGAEVPSDKPELMNFNDTKVILRPRMKIDFQALSDLHVFSFVDDMILSSPGFIRVDSFQIKRKSDLQDALISQINSGSSPVLVDATIEFSWIGLVYKENKDAKSGANPNPSPTP